jgi:hypothetical protein
MRYLVLFFMIMGLRGGLFAQVATPMMQLQPVAPIPTVEFNTNAIPLKLGLMFISGAADGMTQVIAFPP